MGRSIDDMARNYRFFARQYAGGKATEADERRVRQSSRRHRAAIARIQSVCARTIAVLRRHGVAGDLIPLYVAYAQKLHRAGRLHSCLTLANEAVVLTRYWAARGLVPALLAAVCVEVLGFDPDGPEERPCRNCSRRRGCGLAAQ